MPSLDAAFVTSAPSWQQGPTDGRPEVALLGRSNVGKSSLLNRLVGHRGLAKVSATPGKTRLINYFAVAQPRPWYLVDLPGYGFAKVSQADRAAFDRMSGACRAARNGRTWQIAAAEFEELAR